MKKFLIAAAVLLPLFARADEAFDKNTYKRLAAECGKNNLESCVKFAIWTRDDLESPADAYASLKKACDGGHMKSCNVLGNLYLNPYSGLGEDGDKARALYQKACRGGYANACTNLEKLNQESAQSKPALSREQRLQKLLTASTNEDEAACRALQAESEH